MSSLSAGPSWAETSVRWLKTYHPHCVYGSSKRPAKETLGRALSRMTYRGAHADRGEDAWESLSKEGVDLLYHVLAESWSKEDHETMSAWLSAGGYAGWVARRDMDGDDADDALAEAIRSEMSSGKGSSEDGVTIAGAAVAPSAEDPTGELELADILKAEGAGYGTW